MIVNICTQRGPPRGIREVVKVAFLLVKIEKLENKLSEIVKTMSFVIREVVKAVFSFVKMKKFVREIVN